MAAATDPIPGGLTEVDISQIENVVKFDELARFAVEEHNKKENAVDLKFEKVVKVMEQDVSGKNYYITLEATEGDQKQKQKKVYEAKIWVKEWEHFKQLTQFNPSAYP